MTLAERLVALHETLRDAPVPHAFGGAIALAFWTLDPRGTRDLDVNVFVAAGEAGAVLARLPEGIVVPADADEVIAREGQMRLWWDDRADIEAILAAGSASVEAIRASLGTMLDDEDPRWSRLEAAAGRISGSPRPGPGHRNHMSKDQNIAAQEHLAESINAGDVEAAVESFAPDCVDRDPAPGQGEGREGFKQFFTALTTAFPDAKIAPAHLVADDEHVSVAYTLTGTHNGPFNGIDATGKAIEVRGVQIGRFEDGMIVERWGSSDELGIMQQIGAVPTP